jgi:toxoflavin biosynthesis protein ToxD
MAALALAACGGGTVAPAPSAVSYAGGDASISRAADTSMITVPAGPFFIGSTPEERERAYDDHQRTAGDDQARRDGWFELEPGRATARSAAFAIDLTPVTGAAFAEFVADTGASTEIDIERADHPIARVTWHEAEAYCAWRGALVGQLRRLPTAAEYEKAVRGEDGYHYPWGNDFDATRLNSAVDGVGDTVAVGTFPAGASPYGLLDGAGNVAQWTATSWPHEPGAMTIKGSSFADLAGFGRGASARGRPPGTREATLGFRCAG